MVWTGGDSDEDDEYCGEVWDCGGEGEEGMIILFFSFLERVDNESDVLEMSRKTTYYYCTMFWWVGRSQGYS